LKNLRLFTGGSCEDPSSIFALGLSSGTGKQKPAAVTFCSVSR
jgi:hypothetical protein